MDQRLDQTRFRLSQSFAIGRIDCNIAEGRCTVVLNINIGRREQLDKDGNSTSVDELLAVVICISRLDFNPPPVLLRRLLTGVCHVEQSTCRITLNPHILRLCQADQRTQRARAGNLCLVLLVRGQVRNTSDGVALYLYIRRHHLADQRGQPSEGDDQDFVLGYIVSVTGKTVESRQGVRTIYSKVAQCRAGGSLDLNIGTLE